MVRKQGEGITRGSLFGEYIRGTVDESVPVHIIVKDGIPCNASNHQMVHCTGGIDAGMSRHEQIVSAWHW
jgi:hypothetical protein